MQTNPQTHTPFWILGIATACVVVLALLFLSNRTSSSESPTATASPVRIDVEALPIIATTQGSELSTPTLTPLTTASVSPLPSIKGSGKLLFVSDRDGNEEIYVMDVDGGYQTRLTQNPGRDIDPQWSPDGTRIAFLSERENERGLYVMDTTGEQLKLLTSSIVFEEGEFSWSPDSTRLAYSSFPDGYSDISVIQVDGSMEQNLTATDTQSELSPAWSPDGTRIAFYTTYQHQYFIMNSDGSDPTKVVDSANGTWSQPQWSPDGLYLLVSAAEEIFFIPQDTEAVIPLADNQNYDASPAASPDGTNIAFVSSRSQGSHEIFVMEANSDHAEKISNLYDTRAFVSNLLWSSAGNSIIFTISNFSGGTTAEILSIDLNTREIRNLSQDRSSSNYLSDVAP